MNRLAEAAVGIGFVAFTGGVHLLMLLYPALEPVLPR